MPARLKEIRMNRLRCSSCLVLVVWALGGTCFAQDEFRSLVSQLPRSANAVVLLNLEKAKQSPMGVRLGWKEKIEKAFEEGLTRVPPHATRAVLGAQIDFESMRPLWEAAILDLSRAPSLEAIAKTYQGNLDRLDNFDAVILPTGAYVVKLFPTTLGAVAPASRQFALRWLREIRSSAGMPLSPYVEKAAGYSDQAGSDIIIAVDLDGAFTPERVSQYVGSKEWLKKQGVNPGQLAGLLWRAQGIRLGIRIGEEPLGRVAIDLADDAAWTQPFAKQLIIQILEDAGMKIDDLDGWRVVARGKEIALQGNFSPEGLRQVLSLIQSPAPSVNVAGETSSQVPAKGVISSDVPSTRNKPTLDPATASQQNFKAVVRCLNDLKLEKGNIKTFGQHAVFFDRYAKKIERLPILNVDPEVVQYDAFVAQKLREASDAVRMAGIQTGVRKSYVQSESPDVYAYGYAGGWYGGYGYARYAPYADLQYEAAQRRIIRKEETGAARTTEQQIKGDIIAATRDIRIKMTQKYQVEF
jgi:hypothetical protein